MKWKSVVLVLAVVLLIGCQPDNSELWAPGRTYAKGDLCQNEGGSTGSWGVTTRCTWDYESLQNGNRGHEPDLTEGVWWRCVGCENE